MDVQLYNKLGGGRDCMSINIYEYNRMILKCANQYREHIENMNIDMEDLVQEAYIKLLENLDKFDEERGLKPATFIWTVSNNAMINYINKEKLRGEVKLNFSDMAVYNEEENELMEFDPIDEGMLDLEEAYLREEQVAFARNAVEDLAATLSTVQQRVLYDIILSEDPPTQAHLAEELGISQQAVSKILNKLGDMLIKKGNEYV
jgi:RNA polymerase sigma factor (sigma-70 family)